MHAFLQPLLRAGESFPDRRHRLAQDVGNFHIPSDLVAG